jgi:general nucleoside transport system permease protein
VKPTLALDPSFNWLRLAQSPLGRVSITALAFVALASAFFLVIGRDPIELIKLIVQSAVGDKYSLTESLVKATPILLCALATAVPARLGLITVGAEGQLYFGALIGTGFVLSHMQAPALWLIPGMLLVAALAGAAWSLIAGVLKAALNVNETISTLLINYVAALLVTWVVYGPWKDPASQGWPATASFPAAAKLPSYFDSRIHLGLWLAIIAAVALHIVLTRTRWGLALDILRSNPRVGQSVGLHYRRNILLVMLLGGAFAGLAGIAETSAIQGRLQAGISNGAGFSGFLVAWLARNHCLRMIPLAFLVGALLAAGDGVQMLANIPSSVTLVAQGLLFVAVLSVGGWLNREGRRDG